MGTITRITVRRVVNTGNFENTTVEMDAALAWNEDPGASFRELVDEVDMRVAELGAGTPEDPYSPYRAPLRSWHQVRITPAAPPADGAGDDQH